MDIVTYALLNGKVKDIDSKLANKADLVDGRIPAEELPSYVDDVIEYASLNDFPAEGEAGKIYVALDTNFTYRWSGSEYVQVGGQDISEFIEVIPFQDQEPLTDDQLQRADEGRLAIYYGSRFYTVSFKNDSIINFSAFTIAHNNTLSQNVNDILRAQEFVIILNRDTGMLTNPGPMPVSAIGDYGDNYVPANGELSADGKRLIRELNLVPALGGKLDKTNFQYVLWNNEYSAESGYTAGDIVYYEEYLYEAQVDITAPAGDFDNNKWQAITLETLLNRKQDVIADLSDIRSGAALGATAVQQADLTALTNQQIIAAWQANLSGGYEEIPNEYGTTIACSGNYSTVPNDYGTTIVIE